MSYDPEPDDRPTPPRKQHPLLETLPPRDPEEDSPSRRVMLRLPSVTPRLTTLLIAVNVVIYIGAFFVMSVEQRDSLYNWGANNRFYVLNLGEYHRLFTAMFLHSEILMHIVFNMYALYIIGQTVERLFGHARFLIIYFLGGLSGSVLSVLLNDMYVSSVGASGAVFAIFGAEMVFLYRNQKLLGEAAKMQLRHLIMLAGVNVAIGLFSAVGGGSVRIDNWGHVGGLLGGAALAWVVGPLYTLDLDRLQEGKLSVIDVNTLRGNIPPVLIYAVGLVALVLMSAARV